MEGIGKPEIIGGPDYLTPSDIVINFQERLPRLLMAKFDNFFRRIKKLSKENEDLKGEILTPDKLKRLLIVYLNNGGDPNFINQLADKFSKFPQILSKYLSCLDSLKSEFLNPKEKKIIRFIFDQPSIEYYKIIIQNEVDKILKMAILTRNHELEEKTLVVDIVNRTAEILERIQEPNDGDVEKDLSPNDPQEQEANNYSEQILELGIIRNLYSIDWTVIISHVIETLSNQENKEFYTLSILKILKKKGLVEKNLILNLIANCITHKLYTLALALTSFFSVEEVEERLKQVKIIKTKIQKVAGLKITDLNQKAVQILQRTGNTEEASNLEKRKNSI